MDAKQLRELIDRYADACRVGSERLVRELGSQLDAAIDAAQQAAYAEGRKDQAAEPADWIQATERLPNAGDLIVKRWAHNAAAWAGVYAGSAKDSSFDEWVLLAPAGRAR